MKTTRRIFVLFLVALMVLGLAACKKDKEAAGDLSAKELVHSAPLKLQLLMDAEVSIGIDEDGNALAIIGNNEKGIEAAELCDDVVGKTGAEAVKMVLTVIQENDLVIGMNYVIIRQEPETVLPSEDYLQIIGDAAKEALGGMPAIVISAADMDIDGYFNAEIAKQILQVHLGSEAKILNAGVMIDGCYIISCLEDDVQYDYSVSAYSGAVALADELASDVPPVDPEEDQIPPEQQFIPPSDAEEGGIEIEETNPEDVG